MKCDEMKKEQSQNMQFPKYSFVDTAFGGVMNRNRIININDLTIPDTPNECYISMFRFLEELEDHCQKTGSVRGNDNMLCYCDYLWFDIDDQDLAKAQKRTIELILRIESQYDITPVVCFSGSKGFHIGIPSGSFNSQPRPDLPRIFKKMAQRIAGDIKIDTAIYEKNRLWRLPDSINAKSGLYKIRISHEELAKLDVDAIKEKAISPGNPVDDNTNPSRLSASLSQLYEDVITELDRNQSSISIQKNIPTDCAKLCIERILKGVSEGDRNEAGIRLASHYLKPDNSPDEVLNKLIKWNQSNQPPLPDEEIRNIVNSATTKGYDYGCNDPFLKKYCDNKCPLYKSEKKQKAILTSFAAPTDGSLLEMLYNPNSDPETFFARYKGGVVDYVDSHQESGTGKLILPYKPGKIIRTNTIHFPSQVDSFENEIQLLRLINDFIYKYLQISPFFHNISKYYVLLTWVYDCFTNLPYLRVKGDYGSGKSRFLTTVGSLCYKPIFCSGAATVSPIFRLIDAYRGTVIIDESDFTDSDESHRVVKILNSGFQKGFPVLISDTTKSGGFEPTSFDVFGPKLIASRNEFKDKALESRCITEIMEKVTRTDIPINLPSSFWDEARAIRNKLLKWRFNKYGRIDVVCNNPGIPVEPRLAQVMMPLLSIIDDVEIKDEFIAFMQDRNRQIIEERGDSRDGLVADVVLRLWSEDSDINIRVKTIAEEATALLDNPKFTLTSRKIGHILRNSFKLHLEKDRNGFHLVRNSTNNQKLDVIAEKFGIPRAPLTQRSQCAQCSPDVETQGVSL